MRATCNVFFTMIVFVSLLLGGCTGKSAWQEGLEVAAKEQKYALLFINNGNSPETKAMRAHLQELTRNSPQFKIIEANANKDQFMLMKFLNIGSLTKLPMTLAIAPNGAITASFSEKVSPEKLSGCIVSKKEEGLLLSMQKNETVLLCISRGVSKESGTVRSDLQAIGSNYAGKVSVIYADYTDRGDLPLLQKLPPIKTTLAVLALAPNGKIAATLEGEQINRQNLLKAAQSCSTGCSSGCK